LFGWPARVSLAVLLGWEGLTYYEIAE
jgi:hypothetical protein